MNAAAEEGLKQGLQQGMEQGLQQGMEKGLEQGLQQGLEQGAKQEKIAIAKNALSMNMPIEQIIKLTGLTKEEIESL
jgi:predicted transposase/invertase (TIGR01784 family)